MPLSSASNRIDAVTRRISKGLLGLRRDLVALGRAVQTLSAVNGRGSIGASTRAAAGGGRRRRRALTAADRARLRVQGEYLGLVRHLSVRNRTRVKELRAKRGYTPAIRMARRLVKRGR